jgi:hypothetical protein
MIEESLEPVAPTEESGKSKKATLAEGYAKAGTLGVPVTRDELRHLEAS